MTDTGSKKFEGDGTYTFVIDERHVAMDVRWNARMRMLELHDRQVGKKPKADKPYWVFCGEFFDTIVRGRLITF